MVLIGDAFPENVLERNTDLLFEVAKLKREKEELKEDRDRYRNEANRLRRATT